MRKFLVPRACTQTDMVIRENCFLCAPMYEHTKLVKLQQAGINANAGAPVRMHGGGWKP